MPAESGTNGMVERKSHINYAPPNDNAEGDAGKTRSEAERRLLAPTERYYSDIDNLVSKIGLLAVTKDSAVAKDGTPIKDLLREEIADSFSKIEHSQIDEIDNVGKYLEDLRNPYPYDSRWSIQFFDTLLKKINESLRNKDDLDVEGRALLKILKKDVLWSTAVTRICEAMGPAHEVYYDGELQMSLLRTVHSEIKAGDFQRAFGKELKGLNLTEEETGAVSKTLNKIAGVEHTRTVNGQKETLGLRERAVELQDSASRWQMALVSVGQKNLEKGWIMLPDGTYAKNDDEAGEHYMDIDPVTYRLLSIVFNAKHEPGTLSDQLSPEEMYTKLTEDDLEYTNKQGNTYKVKEATFNPFSMPRSDEKAWPLFHARMHEIVKDGSLIERIKKIREGVATLGEKEVDKRIVEEAAKIIRQADKRLENKDVFDEENYFERLVDTVIKNQITLDRGVLASGELGWHWTYSKITEKDQNNLGQKKEKIIRKSGFASLHDDHDVHTVTFWARHIIDYDELAETRGQLLFPSIGFYREKWFSEPPYFRPTVQEFASQDVELQQSLGLIDNKGILGINNIYEKTVGRYVFEQGKKGRHPQFLGKYNEDVAKYVKENMWVFVTPFLNNPGEEDNNYYLSIPIFLPTMIEDINFWRTTNLDVPSKKINLKNSKDSIWHKRLEFKTNLSELDWENMSRYQYNWYRTNLDQMERWLGPMISPHVFNKMTADEYNKHYAMPGGLAEKEGGKRGRLGSRGSKYSDTVVRASVLAQNKIFAAAEAAKKVMPTWLTGAELTQWADGWIAPWINTELDMPLKVRDTLNYGGTAAQNMIVTYRQVKRVLESMIKHSKNQTAEVQQLLRKL